MSMITNEHRDIARWSMDFALKNGCSAARVSVTVSNNSTFEYRNIQLDKLNRSSENKLYIELFVDGRYGSLSTNRLDRNELGNFIKEGIISTRFLAEDLCRQLPNSSRYYKFDNSEDLDLYDHSFFDYTDEQKLELAKATVDEIYGTDDQIISVVASYSDGCADEYMVASNGFEGEICDSAYSIAAEVTLKTEGNARIESYWYDNSLYWTDLKKAGIARKALRRALQKQGQSKIKSGNYPMLLDNTTSSRLLSPLISAMYGGAIQQKNTFLLNKLNTQITSSLLTIMDNPHCKKTFGSRWYDGEGVATKEQTIIEKGVLNTYFIDTYNSLKLGISPTIASPSVLTFDMGEKGFDGLMHSMQRGVWITGFNGGNTNGTTGDFSFGIEGFWVENGVPVKPVSEMNITGNILDVWMSLAEIGNDPFSPYSSRQVPSLLFDNISFSGI